jgi:hypothetical protein
LGAVVFGFGGGRRRRRLGVDVRKRRKRRRRRRRRRTGGVAAVQWPGYVYVQTDFIAGRLVRSRSFALHDTPIAPLMLRYMVTSTRSNKK